MNPLLLYIWRAGFLMKPKLQKQSALTLAGRINETQILQALHNNICKL
jgi:hypothetical protein